MSYFYEIRSPDNSVLKRNGGWQALQSGVEAGDPVLKQFLILGWHIFRIARKVGLLTL